MQGGGGSREQGTLKLDLKGQPGCGREKKKKKNRGGRKCQTEGTACAKAQRLWGRTQGVVGGAMWHRPRVPGGEQPKVRLGRKAEARLSKEWGQDPQCKDWSP